MKPIPRVVVDAVQPVQTIKELASAYKNSTHYRGLSLSTRLQYDKYMELLLDTYGQDRPDSITPRMADAIYTSIKDSGRLRSAQYFVAVWMAVYKFGIRSEIVKVNPWSDMRVTGTKSRTVAWTEAEVFSFIEKALTAGHKELAIAVCLMYDTAQRPSDILALTFDKIEFIDGYAFASVKQLKTGAEVCVSLSPFTLGLIGKFPEDRSKKVVGLNYAECIGQFRKVRQLAGVRSELQLRDLRRTALTEMGAASDDQMISVSGHKNRKMLDTYSQKNRQKALEAQQIRYATRNSRLNTECSASPERNEANDLPVVPGEEHLYSYKDHTGGGL